MNDRFALVLRRCLSACGGAALGTLGVAALEAAAAAGTGAAFGAAWLAALGLLAPVAVLVGAMVGVSMALLWPAGGALRLRAWFWPVDTDVRRQRGLYALLAPPLALLWIVVSARWALRALGSELAPFASGAAVALGCLVLGASILAGLGALARSADAVRVALPGPAVALGLSIALALGALAVLALGGESSGSGSVWSMFGVLRREELDLRPVSWMALLAAAAAAGALGASRRWLWAALLGAFSLVPFAATLRAASGGLEDVGLALALERRSALAGRALGVLRKLADADGDGFAARFGGGDCDDGDRAQSPAADDVPGNGRDEDCSGADARPVARARAPEPVPADARAWALARLPEKPNVVLLTIDTLRADLGYAGNPRKVSPRLDELAAESVVFERAYALASYTSKSLPPMMIGKYCGETGRDYAHFNRFGRGDLFLPERLERAGIRTLSVQGHWYFFQKYGLERGFVAINSSGAPKLAQMEGDRSSTSDKLSDAAIEELGRPELAAQPFFLWAHYTDPHSEYAPHEGFAFGTDSRALYDGEVAFVDHHVGRVLDALRQSAFWDRTIVIVTSDHGEAFREHGMIRHGFELWEELVRVPFLVRVPGVPARRIGTRRSLIDLVPTVLDLFRLPAASGAGTDFMSGQSLLLELAQPPGYRAAERPIFVDMSEGPHNAERRAYIDAGLKLVTSGGRPLGLYDLERDPGERENLVGDRARLAPALDRFKAFVRTLREVRVRPPG